MYRKQKDTEAQRASAFARQQAADSDLYAKKKETAGIIAIANAESIYLNKLMMQLGENYFAVRDCLMIKKKKKHSKRLPRSTRNLLTVFNRKSAFGHKATNQHGDLSRNGGAMKDIAGVYGMLPPFSFFVKGI